MAFVDRLRFMRSGFLAQQSPISRIRAVRKCAKTEADMDWDNVRVFLAVARAGQFVAGARRLHLDHATASRRVAALEAALGAKLFDRRTTGRAADQRRRALSRRRRADGERVPARAGARSPTSTSNSPATCGSARPTGSRPIISPARCATSSRSIPALRRAARAAAAADAAGAARGRYRRRARQAGSGPLRRAQAHRLFARHLRQRRLSRERTARPPTSAISPAIG